MIAVMVLGWIGLLGLVVLLMIARGKAERDARAAFEEWIEEGRP